MPRPAYRHLPAPTADRPRPVECHDHLALDVERRPERLAATADENLAAATARELAIARLSHPMQRL